MNIGSSDGYHWTMHQSLLALLLLLTAAVATVALARRFRLPSMLGYLAVGMALWTPNFRTT